MGVFSIMNFKLTLSIMLLFYAAVCSHAGRINHKAAFDHSYQDIEVDTNRVNFLCQLAYGYANMDSVKYYALEAKNLSQALNFRKGIGRSFWLLGMANYYQENIDSSEYFLEQALKYAQEEKDVKTLGRIYNSSANIANFLGNPSYAVELYFKSLRYKEQLHEPMEEAITLNNIANLFHQQGDYVKAREYYIKSYSKRKEASKLNSALMLLSDMSNNFIKIDMLDSAMYYLMAAKTYSKASNDLLGTADIYSILVRYHDASGNPDSVLFYANLGLAVSQQAKSRDKETMFKLILAKYFNSNKQFEMGYVYADDACKLSKTIGRLSYMKEATLQRSIGLEGLGKSQEALDLFKYYKILNDCTLNNKVKNAVLAKDYQYKLEKARLQAENKRIELESKLSKEKILTVAALISVVIVSIIAFFYYRNFRHKEKINEELLRRQSEIIEKNEEIAIQNQKLNQHKHEIESINSSLEDIVAKRTHEIRESIKTLTLQNQNLEQFSFIVSHNLRAPVARLKGLASLMHYDLCKQDLNSVTQMIKEASADLDIVLSDLTHIINIKSRPLENREIVNLSDLLDGVMALIQDDINSTKAKVEVELNDALEILTIGPYIRSIFTNLLTNAIKYRSPDRNLVIQILGQTTKGFHRYKIIDNGLGIDLRNGNATKIFGLYQRFHTSIEGRGLGLYLVKTQLESLGGQISVASTPDNGTSFTISLPIN